MKFCNGCHTNLRNEHFHRRTSTKDGMRSQCKACERRALAKWRKEHPDNNKAIQTRNRINNREQCCRAQQKRREATPRRYKAYRIVAHAIKDGSIEKPNLCEECNEMSHLHGHHDDYAKPLEVRWLCPRCHNAWHVVNGPGRNPT